MAARRLAYVCCTTNIFVVPSPLNTSSNGNKSSSIEMKAFVDSYRRSSPVQSVSLTRTSSCAIRAIPSSGKRCVFHLTSMPRRRKKKASSAGERLKHQSALRHIRQCASWCSLLRENVARVTGLEHSAPREEYRQGQSPPKPPPRPPAG